MAKKFSPKYRNHVTGRSPYWRAVSKFTLWMFCGRDALIPLLKASHIDHLHYRGLGHELPIIDVLPLHPVTHAFVGALRKIIPRFIVSWVMRAIALFWLLSPLLLVVAILAL